MTSRNFLDHTGLRDMTALDWVLAILISIPLAIALFGLSLIFGSGSRRFEEREAKGTGGNALDRWAERELYFGDPHRDR